MKKIRAFSLALTALAVLSPSRAQDDPSSGYPPAVRQAEALAPGDQRDQSLLRAVRQWAASSPAGALAWAAKTGSAELAGIAYYQWAGTNPGEALRSAFAAQSLGSAKADVLRNLAGQWAAADLPAASVWVLSLPAGEQRNPLVEQVACKMAEATPFEAAKLVMTQIPAGPAQREAILSVLHQWAQSDLAGASAWAATLSPQAGLSERIQRELAGFSSPQNPAPATGGR